MNSKESMTFEEWLKQEPCFEDTSGSEKAIARRAWQAATAQQAQAIDELQTRYDVNTSLLHARTKIMNEQAQRIKELTDALQPLANFAQHYPKVKKFGNRPITGDIYSVMDSNGEHSITVEDAHRAFELLQAISKGEPT